MQPGLQGSGRAGTAPAVVSALVLHVACIGALLGIEHSRTPRTPPQETVVELVMAPAPEPPAPPQPVAEPVIPAPAEPPEAAAAPSETALPPTAEDDPAPVDSSPTEVPPAPEPAAIAAPIPPQVEIAPAPRLPMPPQPARTVSRPHIAATSRAAAARQDITATGAPIDLAARISAAPPRFADQEASLEARIRDAVQAAVHYPASARMMGITGRARVLLDYRSGSVAGPVLTQSSGAPMLDEAALTAARSARYPPAPAEIEGRLLRLLVWVEFMPG